MKMSDKDLDKLFSTQLEDMEIAPSAAVWNNINMQVNGQGDTHNSPVPYLQIAAGIIVLVTAGLLLRPQTEKVDLYGGDTVSVTTSPSRTLVITPQTDVVQQMQVLDVTPASQEAYHRQKRTLAQAEDLPVNNAADTSSNNKNRALLANNTLNDARTSQQQTITEQSLPAPKVLAAVLSGTDHIKPAKVLAVNNPPALKDNTTAKKKKIRSLGDLFNVMIAKVDKRPNKIIQFENNDDEDGDFGVAEVNLGPIQVKKNN